MAQWANSNVFWRYRAIFISLLIFLACNIGILVPTVYISKKLADQTVAINLGGRQRMLSQRMAKALLSLQDNMQRDDVGSGSSVDLQELGMTVYLFNTTLKGFRDGGMVTGVQGNKVYLVQVETPEERRIVSAAYKTWTPYLTRLQPLLENSTFSQAEMNQAVNYVRANNLNIMDLMNDLTVELEHTASRQTERLRWIQLIGITVVFLNVLYTIFKSISDLMKGDRALAKARKETGEILGTVKEGLLLIDQEYRLGSQYSKSVSHVLRRAVAPEMPFFPILEQMVPREIYNNAQDYIKLLLGNRVKEVLITSLNPLNQVEVRDTESGGALRYLNFHFNRAFDEEGKISHLLVTVQDVTELVRLTEQLEAAKGQAQIEVEALLKLLNTDSALLQQFLDNVNKGLTEINQQLQAEASGGQARLHLINRIMSIVHGIKGEAAALDVEMFENYAHVFEKELIIMRDRGNVQGEDMVRITVLLNGFYDQLGLINSIVGKVNENPGKNDDADEKFLQTFTSSLQNLAIRIAGNEGKEVEVVCELENLAQLPRSVSSELHGIAIQLLRNAVKHGIEMPDDRVANGKSASGEIRVIYREIGHRAYEFAVRDDGRGIAVNKIREDLVRRKMFSASEAGKLDNRQIISHLFDPGFSTARQADRDAGHGVGLDVVAKKITGLRGYLTLNSEEHVFTEFKVRFTL
jgi:HPt (histidine-containing phosphotransfer) domain-containing protein